MDVKVIARQSLMHGRLNLRKGEEVTIPEAVAAELERVSLVKRVEVEAVAPTTPAKGGAATARASRSKKESPSANGAQMPAPAGETKPNAPPADASAGNLADGGQGGQGRKQGDVVQTSAQGPDAPTANQAPPAGEQGGTEQDAGAGGDKED